MVKIAHKQVDSFLKSPPADIRAVLIYGPDDGQVRMRAAALGQVIVKDLNDPFNVAELSTAALIDDPAKFTDEMAALSMLGDRRLIRVRDASDKLSALLKSYFKDPAGDGFAVLEAGELGPRSSLRKLFETEKTAAAIACYVEDERSLSQTIASMLRDAGYTADRDALAYLAQNLVGDRAVARGEIEKLMLYMGGPNKITLDDAQICVGDQSELSLDALAQATAGGQTAVLDRELQKLFLDGTGAVYILRVVQNYFKRLHITRARMDGGQSANDAMEQLHPPVFWKQKDTFISQLHAWSLPKLTRVLDELAKTEAKCKQTGTADQTLCARTLFVTAQLARRG